MPTPIDQLLSRTLYNTDGVTTVWDFSFSGGYLDKTHIKAFVEAPTGARTQITVTDPMVTGPYQLTISPALANGDVLTIYRDTPKDLPLVDFTDESGFSEIALDTNAKQAVFIAAETVDTLNTSSTYDAEQAAAQAADSAAIASSAAVSAAASAAAAIVSPVAAPTTAAASKTVPVDADYLPLMDSAASYGLKKLTWGNIKATLLAYFNTLYLAVSALAAAGGAALVGFQPPETGAGMTTLDVELDRKVVSFFRWLTPAQVADVRTGTWYTGDVATKRADMYAALVQAEFWMRTRKVSISFPDGWYEVGNQNFPWRGATVPAVSLVDYSNTALLCTPAVTFATVSPAGADVLQLNGVKNFHVLGYPKLTGQLTGGSIVGSNGCSVTGGYDNVTLQIAPYNCPSVDRGTYIDGGKALSIQTPIAGQTLECSTLVADVRATGCVHGFGFEVDLVAAATMRTAVSVNVVARDCYIAATYSAGAATAALTAGVGSGVKITGQAIDCQQDVVIGRAPGIEVDMQVITTKTAAARRLNPDLVAWRAADTEVSALVCTYAHNSRISVYGNKGSCDYKARIGGASAGSSGLYGATLNSDIYLDLAGSPVTAGIAEVDSGGNSLTTSRLTLTTITTSTVPAGFYSTARKNEICVIGEAGKTLVSGGVRFPVTQVSSSDVNVLDDYEEGTFTPILADTALSAKGATYSLNTGYYTKHGDTVTYTLYIAVTALGTLTVGDGAYIIGLPYASLNASGNISSANIAYAAGLALTAGEIPTARIGSNENVVTLGKWPAAGTTGTVAMTVANVSATGALAVTGSYKTAT